jgi:hypothetical protein
MSSSSEPTRVALVGVGRRARHTILPAVHSLGDRVELAAVFARRARPVELFGGALTLQVRDDLAGADLTDIDVVLIAVDLRRVPAVLRDLTRGSTAMTLMLDTPVLHYRDLGELDTLARFGGALVSEDCLALPPFTLARQLIEEGRVGELKKIYLFHSGYRHHALATLQGVVQAGRPTRLRVQRWGRGSAEVTVGFRTGVEATIVEPREYGAGRFLIAGSKGFIADYPLTHKHATVIGYTFDDGHYRGLLLDGEPVVRCDLDEAFVANVPRTLEDTTPMALLKIRGFMSLLDAVATGAPSPRKAPVDAILDDLSLRVAERTGRFIDLRVGTGSTVSSSALRGLARVAHRLVP